jgi:hypothetical protein
MSLDKDELMRTLGDVGELMNSTPEGRELFQRLRAGELTEDQAARSFLSLLQREGLMGEMVTASKKVATLAEGSEFQNPILTTKTSTGLTQLNPVYEAALAERAFFDGDVPQLRSGRLPEGGTPAVPVLTDLLNPVAVGEMLEQASEKTLKLLEIATEEHAALCAGLISDGEAAGTALEVVKGSLPAKPTGVTGYVAGTEPVPMAGLVPLSGSELDNLVPEIARRYSFKALTSTQGRVSLARPIQASLLELFREAGVTVEGREQGEAAVASATWGMVVSGPEDLSEKFSFPGVAVKALFSDLMNQVLNIPGHTTLGRFTLTVKPHNGASSRSFGWTAHLSEKEDS